MYIFYYLYINILFYNIKVHKSHCYDVYSVSFYAHYMSDEVILWRKIYYIL